MSVHALNISIKLKRIYFFTCNYTKIYFSLNTVCIIGVNISCRSRYTDCYIRIQFFLNSLCHCLSTLV